MIKNYIIITIFLFPFLLLSTKYKVIENENNLEIQFSNVIVQDTLDLPNYLKSEKNGLKYVNFNIALKDNHINKVKYNKANIDFIFNLVEIKREIPIYSLLIPQSIVLNNSSLEIFFEKEIELSEKKPLSSNLFPTILNKRHLNYLLKLPNKVNNNLLSNDEPWFDKNKKYLKIITNQDAIYKIDVNRIIEEFGEVNISNFHIMKDGTLYNNFYIKSNDELLSKDDEFYLFGQIAKGDTTYYEHYTSKVNFYLYHDMDDINNSLTEISPKNLDKLDYVNRNIHLEEENEYSFGNDFRIVSTENNYNEGWVMKFIDGSVNNLKSYSYIIKAFPFDDNVNLTDRFSTIFIHDSLFNQNKILHFLNNSIIDTNYFGKYQKIDYNIKTDNILKGSNKLVIEANSFINNLGDEETSLIYLDYFNLNGRFYPVADNGDLSFETNESQDYYVNVLNLNSDSAISMDTIHRTIEFISTSKEDFISGGVTSNSNYSTLVYNNTSIFSEDKSVLLIYTLNNETKSLISSSIQEINSILAKDLNSFILVNNLDNSDALNSTLSSLGINVNSNKYIAGKFGSNTIYENFNANNTSYLNPIKWENPKSYSAKVTINSGESFIKISDMNSILEPKYENVTFKDLRNKNNKADFLIVTHKSLTEGVEEYLEYRNNTHPEILFKVIYIEDIYNEFSYGNEGPHGLKSFLKYAYNNWEYPKFSYLYLIGETSWDSDMKGKDAKVISLVPTFGLPVSDIWYNDLDSTNQSKEDIFSSRLTANNNEEIKLYLEKLKEFEKNTAAPWFKKTLGVVGGFPHEKNSLLYYTDVTFSELNNSNLGVDTNIIISTYTDKIIDNKLSGDIRKKINNGVIWTNFVGHGAVKVFDFDGWAENQLNNFGKTGILSTISCNTLAFGESTTPQSRNEAYIMYPKTGFIFTYGGTTLGTVGVQNFILTEMMKSISDENLSLRNVMEIKNYGTKQIEGFDVIFQTFNTLGDPLIEIPISKKIELYTIESEISITNNSNFISIDDSLVSLNANVYNNGICTDSTVDVKVIHTFGEKTQVYFTTLDKICSSSEFLLDIEVHAYKGLHNIEIIIDPDNKYDEVDKENNKVSISFNVFDRNILPIEPKNNWDISPINPKFKFYDPNFDIEKDYQLKLIFENDSLLSKKEDLVFEDNLFISWLPEIKLKENIDVDLYYEIKDDFNSLKNQKISLHTKNIVDNRTSLKIDLNSLNINKLIVKKNALYIKDDTLDFTFKANHGVLREQGQDPYHTVDFQLGDNKLLALNVAYTGIYSVRISKYKEYEPIVRYYDTWGRDYKGDIFKDDAIDFVRMLKDTITDDDFLLFTVVGPAINGFQEICQKNEYCYLDSLKEVLKTKFHAKLTDTLKFDTLTKVRGLVGYSLFSSPNFNDTQVIEKVGLYDENEYIRADIEGELIQYNLKASLETNNLKNLKELYSFKIEGEENNSEFKLEIYNKNNELIETIENFKLNTEFDLTKHLISEVSFKLLIERNSINEYPSISSIFFTYKDFPELGVIEDNIRVDTLMRGDSYFVNYNLKNYSFRNDIYNIDHSLKINNQLIYNNTIDTLLKSSVVNINNKLITDNLSTNNILNYSLNDIDKNKEVITNNNQFQNNLNIYEDTIPPVIKVYSNNQLVYDQMFISESPTFTVELYDNSKLPINEVGKFRRVKLNRFIEENELLFRNDYTYELNGDLKATIQFTSDFIEFGDYNTNFLTIIAEDASGNIDTVSYYLNLARLVSINNFIPYPNPFFDEIYLEFEYKGSIDPVEGEIMVYDLSGRLIKNILMKNIQVGKNSILWNSISNEGIETSLGNYVVLIKLGNGMNVKESTIIQKN